MNVAANEDGVDKPGRGNGIETTLARRGVAVPTIGPVAANAVAVLPVHLRDKLLLRDDVPCGVGLLEAIEQPLLLFGAEQGSTGVEAFSATVRGDVTTPQRRHLAWLFGPVLTAVENRKCHEV